MKRTRADLENNQGGHSRLNPCTPLRSDSQILNTGSAAADTDFNNTLAIIPAPGDHNSANQLQFSQHNNIDEEGDQKNEEGMTKTSQVVSFTAGSSSTSGGIDPQNTRIREFEEHLKPPEGTALDDVEDAQLSMEDVHKIGLIGDSHESDNELMSDHNLPLQENPLASNVNGGGSSVIGETDGQSERIFAAPPRLVRMVFESDEQRKTFVEALKNVHVICHNELVRAWMINQKHIFQEYRTGSNVNGGGSTAIGDTGGGQTARSSTEPSIVLTYETYNSLVAALPLLTKIREALNESLNWWTVSYMMSQTTMEKVMAFCRLLKLVGDIDDENLRAFLEEMLRMEKAGLSDDTITRRLRVNVLPAAPVPVMRGEHSDTCSICMAEYKNLDKIASLYYCSHEYHADCIKQWLLKSNVCPMCRALAIIPEHHPDWDGDIKQHRASFMYK